MSGATRLYVEGPRVTARGLTYRARIGSPSGPVIVEASSEPLLDGSRALLAKGISGPVELWDEVRPSPRLTGDIVRLASLTVDENRGTFRRWMAFPVRRSGPKTAKRDCRTFPYLKTETAVFDRHPYTGKCTR